MAVRACPQRGPALFTFLVDCLLFEAERHDDQDEYGELQGEEGAEGGGLGLGHRVSSGCGRGVAQKRPQKPSECTL